MGAGVSVPATLEGARASGFTDEQIAAYQAGYADGLRAAAGERAPPPAPEEPVAEPEPEPAAEPEPEAEREPAAADPIITEAASEMQPEPVPPPGHTLLTSSAAVRDDGSTEVVPVSFDEALYPMYVVHGSVLRGLERLPHHEEALKAGLLQRVSRVETEGRKSNKLLHIESRKRGDAAAAVLGTEVTFISHRWLTPHRDPALAHPDDEANTKLRALKSFVTPKKYAWIDYLCVPQRKKRAKLRAIASLPYYCRCCERFTALVDGKAGRDEYLSRTWCQVELLMSKLPERLPQWRAAWMHTRGRVWDYSGESSGQERCSALLLDALRDLGDCALTVAADAAAIAPLLRFAERELSALLEFDAATRQERAARREFGGGETRIDEDREAWDGIPGWRPVRRADIEAAVGRVRAALSRPPYSAD